MEEKRLVPAPNSDLSQVNGSTAVIVHFKFHLLTQYVLVKNKRKSESEIEPNYCGVRGLLFVISFAFPS